MPPTKLTYTPQQSGVRACACVCMRACRAVRASVIVNACACLFVRVCVCVRECGYVRVPFRAVLMCLCAVVRLYGL
jgi:hypothetical protein